MLKQELKPVKKSIKYLLMLLVVISTQIVNAQYVQTISGRVIDEVTQVELPGATVIITDLTPQLGSTTNTKGEFTIKEVPTGRRTIQISFVGYETVTIPSLMLTSGKEAVLTIGLKESVTTLNELVVTSHSKHNAQNTMTTLSARSFSVEETRRYAGGLDDPGRLASVFAGVSDGNVESNGIIVRGNSPSGVAYRVEGVDVGNPNHFAGEDLLGGGFVSVLSNQVLSNSDFLTGAFPAEYGNATSAVFDMKLRNGNTNKMEHAIQVGVLGIDFSSEGPFKMGKKSSYVVNYRYSTFGLMNNFLPENTGLPAYQDITFKLNFPSNNGTISIWGTGGLDAYKYKKLIDDKYKYGVTGINIKRILNSTTYINTTLAVNAYTKSNRWFTESNSEIYPKSRLESIDGKYTLSFLINKKFNNKHQNRTGINALSMFYKFDNKFSELPSQPLQQISDEKGNSVLLQLYSQSKYSINSKLMINPGIHFQFFTLNGKYSYEPRLGINYSIDNKQMLNFAYGKHCQIQQLNLYFSQIQENGNITKPNKDMNFTTAHHFILGYEYKINENMRFKAEPYIQILRDVPVIADSSFSILNLEVGNTFNEKLINSGSGRNIGIDFTLERFLSNNYYFLITSSIFDSKYKGGDGKLRNIRYNKNFMLNFLTGKEWALGIKRNNIIGVNGRVYIKGGDRYGKIDNLASVQSQEVVFSNDGLFTKRYPISGRVDVSITYTRNKMGVSHIFALQILNVTGTPISSYHIFNTTSNNVEKRVDRFVMPSISWKVEF